MVADMDGDLDSPDLGDSKESVHSDNVSSARTSSWTNYSTEEPEEEGRSTCDEWSAISGNSNGCSGGKQSTPPSSLPRDSASDVAQALPSDAVKMDEIYEEKPKAQDDTWSDDLRRQEIRKIIREEQMRSHIWRSKLAEITAHSRARYAALEELSARWPQGGADGPFEAAAAAGFDLIDDYPVDGETICEEIRQIIEHIDKRTQEISECFSNNPIFKVTDKAREETTSRKSDPPRVESRMSQRTAPPSSLCAQPSRSGTRFLESDSSEETDIDVLKSIQCELAEIESGLDDIYIKYNKLCAKIQRHSPSMVVTPLPRPGSTEQSDGDPKESESVAAQPTPKQLTAKDKPVPRKPSSFRAPLPETETKVESEPKRSGSDYFFIEWKTPSVANRKPKYKKPEAKKPEPEPPKKLLSSHRRAPKQCVCLRPEGALECRKCHDYCFGRPVQICDMHPTRAFVMDFMMCPTCAAPARNLQPSKLSWESICAFRAATLPDEDDDF